MPRFSAASTRATLGALVLTIVASTAGAQTAIGDALVPRNTLDSFNAFILVSGHDVPGALLGQRLASVTALGGPLAPGAFGGGSNVGRQFTPLIVAMSSIENTSFSVVGVGTQRTVLEGIIDYDFGLTAGTDIFGAGMRFAWLNDGLGAFQYDLFDGDGIKFAFSDIDVAAPAVGTSYDTYTASPQDRAYSVNFNLAAVDTPPPTVVPEPSTYAMLAAGLLVMAGLSRKRRSA